MKEFGEMNHRNSLGSSVSSFYPKISKFIEGASFRPRNLVGNVWQERRAALFLQFLQRMRLELAAVKDCPPLLPDVTDDISWPKRSNFYEIIYFWIKKTKHMNQRCFCDSLPPNSFKECALNWPL